MLIPESTLHNSHVISYGAGTMELEPGIADPGCPRLYKARYVDRTLAEPLSMPLSYGSSVHAALFLMEEESVSPEDALQRSWDERLGPDRYAEALRDLNGLLERGGPLTTVNSIAVEQYLEMPLYVDDEHGEIKFGGTLDGIGVDGTVDDPVPNLVFWDYKTNRAPPSKVDVWRWRQGLGYALLLRHNADRWLDARPRIVGVVDAVKWYTLPIEYDDQRLDEYLEWLVSVARAILRDEEGRAKLNPGCSWCQIKDDCPAWRSLPGQGTTLLDRLSSADLTTRVKAMVKAKELRSRLSVQIDETQAALTEKIDVDGVQVIDDVEWYLDQGQLTSIDVRSVQQVLGDEFHQVASVTKKSLDQLMKDRPELTADLSRCMRQVPGSMQLKSRKPE